MRKHVTFIHRRKGESRNQHAALLLVSAAFLLGGFLGSAAAGKLSTALYIQSFLEAAKEGMLTASFWREVWSVFRWPLAVLFLRFLPLSGFSIPIVICLRGFILSYSIAAFAEAGFWQAVLLFGPTCVLTLPVLFILGTNSLLQKAGQKTEYKPAVILACLLSLCLCVVLNQTVIPVLLTQLLAGP